MSNFLPSFVNNGGRGIGNSPTLTVTPPLPATLVAGNLLIAVMAEQNNGIANNTYTVNAPWQVLTTVDDGSGLNRMTIAYTFVRGNGNDVACTFTTAGTGGNGLDSMCFQYTSSKISSPIGNTAKAGSHTAATISCGSITASSDHSLAVAIVFAANATDAWPPSGWVQDVAQGLTNDFYVAHKTLTNQGDTTGSFSSDSDTYWAAINLEILGAQSSAAQTKVDPGTLGFWYNGLPAQPLFKLGAVTGVPSPGNSNKGGKGSGGGSKGNKPPASGVTFDPYGRYSNYYLEVDIETARARRRRQIISQAALTIAATINATCTSSVSRFKQVGKTVAITSTTTTAIIKAVAKALSISATTTTAITALKVIIQIVSATCSSTVSLTKQVGKIVASACSGAVSRSVQVGKHVAITSTGSIAIVKAITHTISVSSTTAVAVLKMVGKIVSATSSSAVSITRQVGKVVGATCSGAVAMTKQVGKIVAVACAATVTVFSQKVFNVFVNVSATTSVAVSKSISKSVAVASASSVAITKQVSKAISATSLSMAAITKQVGKIVNATSTTASALSRSVGKGVNVVASTSVNLARQFAIIVEVLSTGTVATSVHVAKSVSVAASATVDVIKSIAHAISTTVVTNSLTAHVLIGVTKVPPLVLRGIVQSAFALVGYIQSNFTAQASVPDDQITLKSSVEDTPGLHAEVPDPNIPLRDEEAP